MTEDISEHNKTFDSKTALEEKRREEYVHVHRYIDIEDKQGKFYIPKNQQLTFKKLREILRRERKSLSAWILDNAVSYVRLHEPGNPQQRIDIILKNGQAYRAVPLCGCGALATREVHLTSNESVFCCSRHMPKHHVKFFKELKK